MVGAADSVRTAYRDNDVSLHMEPVLISEDSWPLSFARRMIVVSLALASVVTLVGGSLITGSLVFGPVDSPIRLTRGDFLSYAVAVTWPVTMVAFWLLASGVFVTTRHWRASLTLFLICAASSVGPGILFYYFSTAHGSLGMLDIRAISILLVVELVMIHAGSLWFLWYRIVQPIVRRARVEDHTV